jgi:hypothetical protein
MCYFEIFLARLPLAVEREDANRKEGYGKWRIYDFAQWASSIILGPRSQGAVSAAWTVEGEMQERGTAPVHWGLGLHPEKFFRTLRQNPAFSNALR